MHSFPQLEGVYAAAVTPMLPDFSPDLAGVTQLLAFLEQRGCHGVLLLGTTGEGPSFSPEERTAILTEAARQRFQYPNLRLLAGTGTPSLDETIRLTRQAFDLGLDGVVTLPPYYFRKVSDDGLFLWFSQVLQAAVPDHGALLGYHIPPMTEVGFSLNLLSRLKDAFPTRFAGIKDSSGNPEYARQVGAHFGHDLLVLNGNDGLFSLALENQGGGCITAMANLYSPELRQAWEAFQAGKPDVAVQERLGRLRKVLESVPPFPPLIKALFPHLHRLPAWSLRPPLLPISQEKVEQVLKELALEGV